jgi:hypothetical protein
MVIVSLHTPSRPHSTFSHLPDHLIGSPLALASEAYAEKAWVKYDDILALRSPNIRVLQGSVKSVDPQRKVATFAAHGSGEVSDLRYDYFVAATGLRRVRPVVPQSLRRKQFLFEAGDHIRAATAAKHGVVIVGGGTSPHSLSQQAIKSPTNNPQAPSASKWPPSSSSSTRTST